MSHAYIQNRVLGVSLHRAVVRTAMLVTLSLGLSLPALAQTFQVIHNFTGHADGGAPPYTLVMDQCGKLYGTANSGGQNNAGIVFQFAQSHSHWILNPIYNFTGQDGQPGFGLVRAPNGIIYTTASYASVFGGPCGTAIELLPPVTPVTSINSNWTEVVMRTYVKREDGCPSGNLVLDHSGNVYGITTSGGANGWARSCSSCTRNRDGRRTSSTVSRVETMEAILSPD
jgi:hypothetical protein